MERVLSFGEATKRPPRLKLILSDNTVGAYSMPSQLHSILTDVSNLPSAGQIIVPPDVANSTGKDV